MIDFDMSVSKLTRNKIRGLQWSRRGDLNCLGENNANFSIATFAQRISASAELGAFLWMSGWIVGTVKGSSEVVGWIMEALTFMLPSFKHGNISRIACLNNGSVEECPRGLTHLDLDEFDVNTMPAALISTHELARTRRKLSRLLTEPERKVPLQRVANVRKKT
jgi:hypothetical protein